MHRTRLSEWTSVTCRLRGLATTALCLQHLRVKAQIGHHLPQLRILVLELLQPPHLGRQQSVMRRAARRFMNLRGSRRLGFLKIGRDRTVLIISNAFKKTVNIDDGNREEDNDEHPWLQTYVKMGR